MHCECSPSQWARSRRGRPHTDFHVFTQPQQELDKSADLYALQAAEPEIGDSGLFSSNEHGRGMLIPAVNATHDGGGKIAFHMQHATTSVLDEDFLIKSLPVLPPQRLGYRDV